MSPAFIQINTVCMYVAMYGRFSKFTKSTQLIQYHQTKLFCYLMTGPVHLSDNLSNLPLYLYSLCTTFSHTVLCMSCSSITKGQFIPCLKQLVQDGDVDVQYFASEALSIINVNL